MGLQCMLIRQMRNLFTDQLLIDFSILILKKSTFGAIILLYVILTNTTFDMYCNSYAF